MRSRRDAREAHGGVRGALRALPGPARLDGGRHSRGKEGRVVRVIVRSTERTEGAASILAMLEEKADGGRDPVGDSRREMRARELRGGSGRSLGRGVKTRIFFPVA